jgi:hypothetical protein
MQYQLLYYNNFDLVESKKIGSECFESCKNTKQTRDKDNTASLLVIWAIRKQHEQSLKARVHCGGRGVRSLFIPFFPANML